MVFGRSQKPVQRQSQTQGFTLVEVLVALGIFAMLATGYLIAAGDAVKGVGRVQDKMVALWVAQDTLVRLRTLEAQNQSRFSEREVDLFERQWVVSFEQEATDVQTMSRVRISVASSDDKQTSLASLETYFVE